MTSNRRAPGAAMDGRATAVAAASGEKKKLPAPRRPPSRAALKTEIPPAASLLVGFDTVEQQQEHGTNSVV